MVVLVFLMLLSIGIIFFISQSQSKMKEKQGEILEFEIIKRSQVLNFLPELQCSFDGVINNNCYDLIKINKFIEIKDEHVSDYKIFLGNVRLNITQYDPSPEIDEVVESWIVFDNPKLSDQGYRQVQYPISLYDAVEDCYYFGILELRVYI